MTAAQIEPPPSNKLIHIAKIYASDGVHRYLFLRKVHGEHFIWCEEQNEEIEIETEVTGATIEEALRLAVVKWKFQSFRTVICGFRYTLPERDEHGINALFHQMAASLSTINGIYYDEELGNNCFVQSASIEAFHLWQRLKNGKRL